VSAEAEIEGLGCIVALLMLLAAILASFLIGDWNRAKLEQIDRQRGVTKEAKP